MAYCVSPTDCGLEWIKRHSNSIWLVVKVLFVASVICFLAAHAHVANRHLHGMQRSVAAIKRTHRGLAHGKGCLKSLVLREIMRRGVKSGEEEVFIKSIMGLLENAFDEIGEQWSTPPETPTPAAEEGETGVTRENGTQESSSFGGEAAEEIHFT